MSLGYSPLSATFSLKTRTSSRATRNPFRASCLFAPPPFAPTASSSLGGPSRLQGRPFSIESSRSPSKRTRSRKQSSAARSEATGSSESPSPLCCLPPRPSTSSSPSPPPSSLLSLHGSSPLPPSPYRISSLSSPPPPPRTNRKPPPWTRPTTTLSSLGRRPFPLHLQQHQLLTTRASSHRSLLLQRALSSSSTLSKATLAPDSPTEQPSPLEVLESEEVPLRREDDEPPSVVLHEEQEAILQKVLLGESCFLSGSAGSGKSVLLRAMIAALKSRGKVVGVTATTGIAAQGLDPVEGRTINGWSGIRPDVSDASKLVKDVGFKNYIETWQETDVLVVDEISMMSDSFMNLLSNVGKKARDDPSPFGGLQVIFAGDFAQLPPVIKDNSSQNGNKHFAFTSSSWKQTLPASKCHFLEHAHRQKDPRFARMLDRMRFGEHTVRDVKLFNALAENYQSKKKHNPAYEKYLDGIEPTILCSRNKAVDLENETRLEALGDVEGYTYKATDDNSGAVEKLKNSKKPKLESVSDALRGLHAQTNMLNDIKLKIGARVMVVQNHTIGSHQIIKAADGQEQPSIELDTHHGQPVHLVDAVSGDASDSAAVGAAAPVIHRLYNGMQGVVEGFVPQKPQKSKKADEALHQSFPMFPVVRFTNGAVIQVGPIVTEYGKKTRWSQPDATRTQLPLKLAWAMSIHKSQGQTLERARIDLSNPWEVGQTYVAISRATSLDTLEITAFDSRRVFVDPSVVEFYKSFRKKPVVVASPIVPTVLKIQEVVEQPLAAELPPPSITVESPPSPATVVASPSPPFIFPPLPSPSASKPITASEPSSPPTSTSQTWLHPSPDRIFRSPPPSSSTNLRPSSLERQKRAAVPSQTPLHPSPERSTEPYPDFYIHSPSELEAAYTQEDQKFKELIRFLERRGGGSKESSAGRVSH